MNTDTRRYLKQVAVLLTGATMFMIAGAQVLAADATNTNTMESDLRWIVGDLRDTPEHPLLETSLHRYVEQQGLSSQEMGRLLLKIMNDSLGTMDEETVGQMAICAIGMLGIEDAFDELRAFVMTNTIDRTEYKTSRGYALTSALTVAGPKLIPFAREIRAGKGFRTSDSFKMYQRLQRVLEEVPIPAGNKGAETQKARREATVAFLVESMGTVTDPDYLIQIDKALCKSIVQYGVSLERDGFLRRIESQCERVEREEGKAQPDVRDYVTKETETLQRVPKEKRTSVKDLVKSLPEITRPHP